jgi:hypothetical protein
MMKTPTIVLLALLSAVAAGCAARQAEMAAASAPTANVAGVWTGSGGTGGVFVPVTLTLTQNDAAVKGTISVGGRPDYSGDVTGSVQGELLRLALPTTTLAELRVKQDTIAGEPFAGLPLNLRRVR